MTKKEKHLKRVHELAQKGVPETEIAKETGLCAATVSFITTRYWEDKMENKQP